MKLKLDQRTRAYTYRVALALLAVLSMYGLVGPDEIPVWTGVLVAVLGIGSSGLATVNTTRKLPSLPPQKTSEFV
jgi:hypothetical protein